MQPTPKQWLNQALKWDAIIRKVGPRSFLFPWLVACRNEALDEAAKLESGEC